MTVQADRESSGRPARESMITRLSDFPANASTLEQLACRALSRRYGSARAQKAASTEQAAGSSCPQSMYGVDVSTQALTI